MTQPQDPEYPPPANPVPPTSSTGPLRPPRRSCGSRILGVLGWLLTLALSVLLALAAAATLLFFYFGIDLTAPEQLRRASGDVAALQGQAAALEAEVSALRTAEADRAGDLATARERIDELERQAGDLAARSGTAAALGQELNENIALAATIQAEGREGQVLVAVVATVQAENSGRLNELQNRTDRLVRFLQRLGDIAGDATLDESPQPGGASPSPTATLPVTPAPSGTPEAISTPQAGADTTPTPTATP